MKFIMVRIKKHLLSVVLGVLFSISLSAQNQLKPNILFIFADDQTFESIGSLNNDEIKTPNLDRLKDMGVTFTHTFNQGSWSPAVCLASRSMLNTGKFVWKTSRLRENNKAHRKSKHKFKNESATLDTSVLSTGYCLNL